MTNREIAEKIYADLNKRGAGLGNASIGIITNSLDEMQVNFISSKQVVSGQLNCPNCKRKTKTINNDETMAGCFHCGTKWAI